MDSNEAQQFQRNELKIQALLERVSGLTSEYENKDADRRIDITLLSQRVQQLEGELNEARGQLAEYEAPEEIVIEPDSD